MDLALEQRGRSITLIETQVLGTGGQARVFPVEGHPEWAAKVYHKPDFRHATKLAVMVANPPEDPMAARGHASIAWPLDLLVDSGGSVAGFLMPRVNGTRPIIDYFNPKTRRKACPGFNYFYLLRTARNLAAALHAIHSRGYVVGDLNDANILVSQTALVTLVDTDSFQVQDSQSGECYRCPVGRLEYSAPEVLARVSQGLSFASLDRKAEQDLFGLAVLLFQLLMEGTHPFAGVYLGAADAPTYSERILAGHFAYYQGQEKPYQPAPLAPPFELLHPFLQQTFMECFVEGQKQPGARHGAMAWVRLLDEVAREVVYCQANGQHAYWPHLKSCPWCERKARLGGRDPFPALASAPPPVAVEAAVASGAAATSPSSGPLKVSTSFAQRQEDLRREQEAQSQDEAQPRNKPVRVILPTQPEVGSPSGARKSASAEPERYTKANAWLLAALAVLGILAVAPYWLSITVRGQVSPPAGRTFSLNRLPSDLKAQYEKGNQWREVEVLAIRHASLKQLVQEYNAEIIKKADYYERDLANRSVTGSRDAIEEQWRQLKAKALADRVYGKNNAMGNSEGSRRPFPVARAYSQGRFKIKLPRGGSWCFFVTACAPDRSVYFYCKEKTFLLNRSLEIDLMDKFASRSGEAKREGTGPTTKELDQANAEFLVACLKKRYGLADPSLGSSGSPGYRNRPVSLMATEDSVRTSGDSRNVGATALWILVGLAYIVHARLQKSPVPLLGGVAILFLAVAGVLGWVWTSVCCLMVMAVVFAVGRRESADF
jgi:hypothetical protein